MVEGLGFRVEGQGLGFRVLGLKLKFGEGLAEGRGGGGWIRTMGGEPRTEQHPLFAIRRPRVTPRAPCKEKVGHGSPKSQG